MKTLWFFVVVKKHHIHNKLFANNATLINRLLCKTCVALSKVSEYVLQNGKIVYKSHRIKNNDKNSKNGNFGCTISKTLMHRLLHRFWRLFNFFF